MSTAGGQWTQVGEDRVVYAGWTRVVQRTLRLPDGRETVWDMVVSRPSVAVLPLTTDGEVVCIRQFRPGPGRRVLSIPGGLIDPGEQVGDAAERELREETGYAAASVEVVASTVPNKETERLWAAVARGCEPAHPQSLDEFEDCEVVLLSLPDFRSRLRSGHLGAVSQSYLALDHLGLL